MHKTLAGSIAAIAVTCFVAGPAFAQGGAAATPSPSPAKAALAKEIIAVSLPKETTQRMLNDVSRAMTAQVAQLMPRMVDESIEAFTKVRNLTPDEKAKLVAEKPVLVDDYRKRMLPEFDKGLRDMYVRLDPAKDMATAFQGWYEQNFTEAELRQILAFQKTPVAAKLREIQPAFMAQTSQQVMGRMAEQLPAVLSKAASSPVFADIVDARLCTDKTPKFCNKSASK